MNIDPAHLETVKEATKVAWAWTLAKFAANPYVVSAIFIGGAYVVWATVSLFLDKKEGEWREKMTPMIIILAIGIIFFLFLLTITTSAEKLVLP